MAVKPPFRCSARSRAAPKSISTGTPPAVTMMFDGLMSRCRMPMSWMAAQPSSNWSKIGVKLAVSIGPLVPTMASSVAPETSSITI